jgi:hypothetical protein
MKKEQKTKEKEKENLKNWFDKFKKFMLVSK